MLDEFEVPSCAERRAAGGAGRGGSHPSLAAHANGAIANFEPGDSQPVDPVSIPHVSATSQRCLFLQTQLPHECLYRI